MFYDYNHKTSGARGSLLDILMYIDSLCFMAAYIQYLYAYINLIFLGLDR